MKRITVVSGFVVVAIASAIVAAESQRRLLGARSLQEAVAVAGATATPPVPGEVNAQTTSPRVLLAAAIALVARNETESAERVLAAVLRRSEDPAVLRDARFTLANLYLRQGLQPDLDPARARSLLEIAKQRYRDHLLDEPDDMDARWNLERALRAAPEGEGAIEPDTGRPVKSVNVIVPDFAPADLP